MPESVGDSSTIQNRANTGRTSDLVALGEMAPKPEQNECGVGQAAVALVGAIAAAVLMPRLVREPARQKQITAPDAVQKASLAWRITRSWHDAGQVVVFTTRNLAAPPNPTNPQIQP